VGEAGDPGRDAEDGTPGADGKNAPDAAPQRRIRCVRECPPPIAGNPGPVGRPGPKGTFIAILYSFRVPV
jgi:hypothetical protein